MMRYVLHRCIVDEIVLFKTYCHGIVDENHNEDISLITFNEKIATSRQGGTKQAHKNNYSLPGRNDKEMGEVRQRHCATYLPPEVLGPVPVEALPVAAGPAAGLSGRVEWARTGGEVICGVWEKE